MYRCTIYHEIGCSILDQLDVRLRIELTVSTTLQDDSSVHLLFYGSGCPSEMILFATCSGDVLLLARRKRNSSTP